MMNRLQDLHKTSVLVPAVGGELDQTFLINVIGIPAIMLNNHWSFVTCLLNLFYFVCGKYASYRNYIVYNGIACELHLLYFDGEVHIYCHLPSKQEC